MVCNTGWLTRYDDSKTISGVKIIHKGASASSAYVYIYTPWGSLVKATLPYGASILPNEYRNPKIPSESVVIGYIEYWVSTGKAGRAIRLRVCYNAPDKSWIDPDKPDEPTMTKAQIISNHSDKLGYAVGDIIKSECVVKNIGGAGTIFLTVGLGYIDSSNMIFLTGFPATDQLFLSYQQLYTFKEDVKVDITDYYRQRGIGWAYLQQQMYLFFLVGHKTDGDLVWDTERHIKIYIDEPGGFKDPTDLDETIIDDIIPDVIDDIIGGFGGLGGLKWAYDKTKDIEHVPDWIADKLRGEENGEPPDLMPLIYIGFAGLVGYLLIRSRG